MDCHPACPGILDCIAITKNVILYPPLAEVDKGLSTCKLDEHYGCINRPPPTPASGGHAKSHSPGFPAGQALADGRLAITKNITTQFLRCN